MNPKRVSQACQGRSCNSIPFCVLNNHTVVVGQSGYLFFFAQSDYGGTVGAYEMITPSPPPLPSPNR